MNYRDYIFSDSKKIKKPWYKYIWKYSKLVLYLFLIISTLWCCFQMFSSQFQSYQIVDATGKSVYQPGVFFEILVGITGGKEHYFHIVDGKIYEYGYLGIHTWGEAFTKTSSPFYGCFVFPIAWILINLVNDFGGVNSGAGILGAIFLTSLLVRLISLVFTWKTQRNQDKMQLLQMKQSEIQAKFKNSNDPAAKQKQQLEIMQLYKKEGTSPFSALASAFLPFPFLVAMYTVVKSARELKLASIGQISLIEQPWSMVTSGHYMYLLLVFAYLPMQILSMMLPTILNLKRYKVVNKDQKKARKKQYIMQGVFVIVFFFIVWTIASGVVIYWIFSAIIQILQTLLFHYIRIKDRKKNKNRKKGINKSELYWYQKLILPFKKIFVKNKKQKIIDVKNSEITNKENSKVSYNPLKQKNNKKLSIFQLNQKKKKDK